MWAIISVLKYNLLSKKSNIIQLHTNRKEFKKIDVLEGNKFSFNDFEDSITGIPKLKILNADSPNNWILINSFPKGVFEIIIRNETIEGITPKTSKITSVLKKSNLFFKNQVYFIFIFL